MLQKIPMYVELSKIVAAHHERYDGRGYPHGFKEEDILPLSRIMIVADAFDAMTTNRIYKPRMSIERALEEIKSLSAIQFHPEVVQIALDVFQNITIDTSTSQLPSTEMEKKRFAFFFEDSMTKSYNQNYLDLVLIQNRNNPVTQYINIIFIHNFGAYNNTHGWDKGDGFLNSFVNLLRTSYPDNLIFRLHGDDFVILSDSPSPINLDVFTPLLLASHNLVTLGHQQFSTKDDTIFSLEELELRLK